jgi:hypothetical protein
MMESLMGDYHPRLIKLDYERPDPAAWPDLEV